MSFLCINILGKHPEQSCQSENGILSLKLGLENFISMNIQHFSHPGSAH